MLIEEIVADRDWRMRELEFLKKLDKRTLYKELDDTGRKLYYRMCVPIIYAHWEGFVSSCFRNVIDFINRQSLSRDEIINEVFAFSQKRTFQTLSGKQSFRQRCDFSEKFISAFTQPLRIDSNLFDTKSNLKFEVLEEVLSWFKLSSAPYQPYQQDINRLVNVRNAIAHGQNSIIVSYKDLEKYIKMVNDLFDITVLLLEDYLLTCGYKKAIS